jgi:hypothetical protein
MSWSFVERTGFIGPLIHQYMSGETQQDGAPEQDEAGTSGEAGRRDDAATPSEIIEQV